MHSSRRGGGGRFSAQGWQHHRRIAPKPKRKLSKAGRAAIVAALKKRWAAKEAAAKTQPAKKNATRKAAIKKAAVKKTAPASSLAATGQ
jgi:hypothetical protein